MNLLHLKEFLFFSINILKNMMVPASTMNEKIQKTKDEGKKKKAIEHQFQKLLCIF